MTSAWERVGRGEHAAWVGPEVPSPPRDMRVRVLRVDCAASPGPLGAISEARALAVALLGGPRSSALDDVWSGLRRRLVGVPEQRGVRSDFVATLNRLQAISGNPVVLVMDHVDSADRATHEVLRDLVRRDSALRVPLLLGVDSEPRARDLLDALGDDAIERASEVDASRQPPPVAPRSEAESGGDIQSASEELSAALEDLGPDARRVLRAAAVAGPAVEVEVLSALLGAEPLDVLEVMQDAVDAGVPIDDLGNGRVRLRADLADLLERSLMPSLAAAWHRRLADILAQPLPEDRPPPSIPAVLRPEFADAEPAAAEPPEPVTHVRVPEPEPPAVEPPPPVAEAPDADVDYTAPSPGVRITESRAERSQQPPSLFDERVSRGDHSRAAEHAEAAGELDLAARRHASAARHALELGAPRQALRHLERALELLESQPQTPLRREERVRLLAELARLRWLGTDPEQPMSLDEALKAAAAARQALRPGDSPELRAELAALEASIHYDIGGKEALEAALRVLTDAGKELVDSGHALEAARLLNDEAAVWVRIGDPVRANHLLQKSREVFSKLAPQHEIARVELAETEHLLARMVLHAESRPGKQAEALRFGIEQALAAEETYRELGQLREAARVWETLGRLELASARHDRAARHLMRAVDAQQQLGDAVGLARSTAALADVLIETGRYGRALDVLASSIALNWDKQSPVGLAFNRKGYERLVDAMPDDELARFEPVVRQLDRELAAAEEALGRVALSERA